MNARLDTQRRDAGTPARTAQSAVASIVLSAAIAAGAHRLGAQEADAPRGAAPSISCSDDTCRSEEGLLFKLRTRSYDEGVTQGTGASSSSEALQPDRRATIAMEPPGKATMTGRFSIALPGGAVIWATEDPTLGEPVLSVSAQSFVSFDGQSINTPLRFFVRSNYPAFIARYEITLYRSSDGDLIEPIARIPLEVAAVAETTWRGTLPESGRFRAGDELVYVLRAYDAAGNFDETWPRTLQLVTPAEAQRGLERIRDAGEREFAGALTAEQAQTESLIDSVFAENRVRRQNIAIYGSRIRVQGRDLAPGLALTINGTRYPVDRERKFAAEYLVPVGSHAFEIGLDGGDGEPVRHVLNVDVSGRYFFGVGLAEATVAQNDIDGSAQPFQVDDRAGDDVLYDGRIAFYLKAKMRAKYLVTAQADTTERDLEHLFDGFADAEPTDVFRRLDPDLYYPTYGDDSTTYRDVDTQGKFYVRVDWDQNQALWGNYSTGLTGTEYAQYVRSLYGAIGDWRSRSTNPWGDAASMLRVFGAEPQSAPGHSEFIGTGGSLYYLRHADILPGSDTVWLEMLDQTTGRVENRVQLLRGADYEIDELQGRILLTRPLGHVTRDNVASLTRDSPLDGFENRLLVDYEWVPSGFDDTQLTGGVRGKHWFGDHVALGATYVDEDRGGEDYALKGADLTLQAGKGTYIKIELSKTEDTSAPVFFSLNGGFTFFPTNPGAGRSGDAQVFEARANFRELGWSERDMSAGAWSREIEDGYSVSRNDPGRLIEEYGAEFLGQVTERFRFYSRASHAERGGIDSLEQVQATGEWRLTDVDTLGAELRGVDEQQFGVETTGVLGALKYGRRFGTSLDLYGIGQATLDDDDGNYADNDALTIGSKYLFGDFATLGGEVTSGDRGNATQITAEYRVSPEQTLYGGYTYSTDTTMHDSLFNPNRQNGSTFGQRWRLSDQVSQFNESQYVKTPNESGLSHMFGMDFYPARAWNVGFAVQDGELINFTGNVVDRRAISLRGGRTGPDTEWQSKVEWRRDRNGESREQWVSTNRLTHKLNDSWSVALRLNYSDTDAPLPTVTAKFVEGNAGFAWRPWNSSRWSAFGRYTYLYDLGTLGQLNAAIYDQRSEILSLEGVRRLNSRWELGGKIAHRSGEARFTRGEGPWFDSTALFGALQGRFELLERWHALAEWRWLDVEDGGTQRGALLGVDRDLLRNFRLGVGYNFTDFSDDLTDFDYDHNGWFVNFSGRY